jgi:hypothetical protein
MSNEEGETVHIEKTDDEEEINARNEVSIFINDFNSDGNRNKQVILKDKDISAKELLELAKETLREDFTLTTKKSKSAPGMS